MIFNGSRMQYAYYERGFPLPAYRFLPAVKGPDDNSSVTGAGLPEATTKSYLMIAIDGSVSLAILLATFFLCEWLIRRRAARRGVMNGCSSFFHLVNFRAARATV